MFVVVVVIAISEIISHCSLIRHDNIEPKGIVGKALSIFDIVVSRNTTNGLSVPFDGHINFNGVLNIDDCDVLFEDVARFVVGYNSVSTSAIQRRYDIGYMRANKIMNELEMVGIVGVSQGENPRAVLVNKIELERIFSLTGFANCGLRNKSEPKLFSFSFIFLMSASVRSFRPTEYHSEPSSGIFLKIKRAYRRPKSEISSFGFRRYALWVN